ncbi:UPF0586 protein [Symbiodinium microadriaticum]|uniref:UPF0586 protein n=1 Tax=Symbiodinium microadriaticum TaxID=2951 RepID=A0A1Q9EVU2_SYMMI|nr:UPF0586 protein [Symbiodinium microadriaticum]
MKVETLNMMISDLSQAAESLCRALEVWEKSQNDTGSATRDIAATLHSLGNVHRGRRDPAAAQQALDGALQIREATLGPDSCSASDAMPAKPKTGGGYASGQIPDDDESDDSDEGQSRVDAGTGPDAETQPQISRASTAEAERGLRSKQEEKAHFLEVCLLGLTFQECHTQSRTAGYSFMEYGTDAYYDLGRMQETVQSLDKADMAMWKIALSNLAKECRKKGKHGATSQAIFRLLDFTESNFEGLTFNESSAGDRTALGVRGLAHKFPLPAEGLRGRSRTAGVAARDPGLPGPFLVVLAGNEFSYHMLLGSHLILNRSDRAECFNIFPFVKVPDICPCEALAPTAQLSMAAGEFVEDTAKNVFMYIRLIAHIMYEPPGALITSKQETEEPALFCREAEGERLSWEEVKPEICKYFDILEESEKIARYTGNAEGLSVNKNSTVRAEFQRTAANIEFQGIDASSSLRNGTHPDTARTRHCLGLVHAGLGERSRALQELERSASTLKASLGSKHPWTKQARVDAEALRATLEASDSG